ncbi:MAG: hypothetical protein IKZ82_10815 [Clostridia bacterium]|nr:hypothetical protein [Clostridia bacterium]
MSYNKIVFDEPPAPLEYINLPTGEGDVWLRRNITQISRQDDEGNSYPAWEAEEAYMRTTAHEAEIAANFDLFFGYAAAWSYLDLQKQHRKLTPEEKIAQLEEHNRELRSTLIDTELALCELFETMIGGE